MFLTIEGINTILYLCFFRSRIHPSILSAKYPLMSIGIEPLEREPRTGRSVSQLECSPLPPPAAEKHFLCSDQRQKGGALYRVVHIRSGRYLQA